MKKIFGIIFIVMIGSLIFSSLITTETAAEPIELQFESYMTHSNMYALLPKWFFDTIAERSKGQVKMKYFWGGSLHGAIDVFPAISKGISDAGEMSAGYYRSELPLTNGFQMVYLFEKPDVLIRGVTRLYDTFTPFREEWEVKHNVKLLFLIISSDCVNISNRPVRNRKELENSKIRTLGWLADAAKRLGATPLNIVQGEIYTSLQRGIINAVWGMSFQPAWSMKHYEAARYWSDIGIEIYDTVPIIMNLDSWKKLPPNIKQIINNLIDEVPSKYCEHFKTHNLIAIKDFIEKGGMHFFVWPDEEKRKAKEKVQPAQMNAWIKETESKGLPAKDFMDKILNYQSEHKNESQYVSPWKQLEEMGVDVHSGN